MTVAVIRRQRRPRSTPGQARASRQMHGVIPVVPICLDLSIDLGGDDQQASRQGVVVFASPLIQRQPDPSERRIGGADQRADQPPLRRARIGYVRLARASAADRGSEDRDGSAWLRLAQRRCGLRRDAQHVAPRPRSSPAKPWSATTRRPGRGIAEPKQAAPGVLWQAHRTDRP